MATVKELDIISGEVLVFILRKLGKDTNTGNSETITDVLSIIGVLATKVFLSLRHGQANRGDGKGVMVATFHKWTSMIHGTITSNKFGPIFSEHVLKGEADLNFYESALQKMKEKC
jgi:hypothetical protein